MPLDVDDGNDLHGQEGRNSGRANFGKCNGPRDALRRDHPSDEVAEAKVCAWTLFRMELGSKNRSTAIAK